VGGGSDVSVIIMFADQTFLLGLETTTARFDRKHISHIISQVASYETTSDLWNNYLPIATPSIL
jgi:hypothetical protein